MTLASSYPPATRWAWLDLLGDGTVTVPLENYAQGYFCSDLDLGAPAVRPVVTPRPDNSGEDDRTQYLAGRVVTINISAFAGAGAVIDAVPGLFGRFMDPAARPVLHYVLNRPGQPERTLGLRAAAFAWPVNASDRRDIQLQFEAPDPVIRDPRTQSATSWAGSTAPGRVYPLIFPRSYPTGGAQSNATFSSAGDVAMRPVFRIYGPITHAQVNLQSQNPTGTNFIILCAPGYQIAAGHYLQFDALGRTVTLDGTTPAMQAMDWGNTTWPYLAPAPQSWVMSLQGDPTGLVTSGVTQVTASWADGYLT
jgi:hypothetical protein